MPTRSWVPFRVHTCADSKEKVLSAVCCRACRRVFLFFVVVYKRLADTGMLADNIQCVQFGEKNLLAFFVCLLYLFFFFFGHSRKTFVKSSIHRAHVLSLSVVWDSS